MASSTVQNLPSVSEITVHNLPKVSVIIPVYNGGENFHRCLTSMAKAASSALEVIVVADGDTDGSWLLAKNFGVKVIRNPKSVGPAKARNLGAKVARGEVLFFVDADVEIYPETIDKVAIAFQQEPEIAALIGCYDDAPGADNFLSQYKNLFHHYTHQTASEQASTFWGACGAIRRDVFLEIGGFDESYRHPSVEDIELGYRLKHHGYQIKLCKHIQVKHLKCWKVISLLKAEIFYRALPWTALILRDRQIINDLNLNLTNRISVVLLYALLGSVIAACWWTSSLILTFTFSLALLILNASVYQFFWEKRGFSFTLLTIFWHWLYYLYSGLAFAIGLVRHQILNKPRYSFRLFQNFS
ncbi:glycosyltransferase [Cylindrospermum sp. FACHB-282]|uniref:glycosyltransferase n=1 Tax=Cylindrospermum sp. FACHB-282 TaxID=2692794 RepID=UPI001684EA8F|nr:glycosyltransferase [Cylindrospermum sp. FACHB-282]MBD2387212.1 glycosyltransferase [Cylindrospermum sp. FACHB-282]